MESFVLRPEGPFSWELAQDVMCNFPPTRRHGKTSADGIVRLAFPLDGDHAPAGVALRWHDGALHGDVYGTSRVEDVARQIGRIYSLDFDATEYPKVGEREPKIGRVMSRLPGLRPVLFTSPYECAAWAIVSQRISKAQAANVLERFVAEHGHRVEVAGATVYAFPEPKRLAKVQRIPGIAQVKIDRLHAVAHAASAGDLDAETIRREGPDRLRAIPGIGPFWSSGIYLRAAGVVDEFPDEPLSVAALAELHGIKGTPSLEKITKLTEPYRPFRMWTCFLLRVAAGRGLLSAP